MSCACLAALTNLGVSEQLTLDANKPRAATAATDDLRTILAYLYQFVKESLIIIA